MSIKYNEYENHDDYVAARNSFIYNEDGDRTLLCRRRIKRLTCPKTNFRQVALLIFALLIPFCVYTAEKPEDDVKVTLTEIGEDTAESRKVGTYTMILGEDAILRGKPDSFCTELLKNLKELENEEFMACGMKFSPKYPEYRNLEWVKLDVKKNKERLEKIILSHLTVSGGESSKYSLLNRIMEGLLNGTTVAMEASIEGLFPEEKSTVLIISRSECPVNAGYAYILGVGGQIFEELEPTLSKKEIGYWLWGGGSFFYYKERLMNVTTEVFSSANNNWKADGRLVVGDVLGVTLFDAEGNVTRTGLADMRQCEYIWNRIEE